MRCCCSVTYDLNLPLKRLTLHLSIYLQEVDISRYVSCAQGCFIRSFLWNIDVKNINLQIKNKNVFMMFFYTFIKTFFLTCIKDIKAAKKHKNTCFLNCYKT